MKPELVSEEVLNELYQKDHKRCAEHQLDENLDPYAWKLGARAALKELSIVEVLSLSCHKNCNDCDHFHSEAGCIVEEAFNKMLREGAILVRPTKSA